MPELDVINLENSKVGTVQLDERIFAVRVKSATIHEAVVMQRACMRQGTAAVKTRGLVRGGGRKPWRQKGTGRARHGSIRSPIWRGGGTVFGPQPRSYAYTLPRKKYRVALFGALSAKCADGEITVLDELSLPDAKARSLAAVLRKIGLSGKTLVVVKEIRPELEAASRNIPGLTLMTTRGLNVYDLVSHANVLATRDAISEIQEVWS